MKKPKLILEHFEPKEEKLLSEELLAKILGGNENMESQNEDDTSNPPGYTYSIERRIEIEKAKEK